MIINVFTFNGEYEMLDVHLSYMYPYVDEFFIIQGNRTFSGFQKEIQYYFPLSHNHFDIQKYQDKIKYYQFDAAQYMRTHNLKPYTFLRHRDITSWYIENTTRCQWIQYAQKLYQKNPDQELIVIISDLDEIPNMNNMEKIYEQFKDEHYIISLDGTLFFKGKFNVLADIKGGIYLKFVNVTKLFQNNLMIYNDWWFSFNYCMYQKGVVKNLPHIISGKNMGWHFSCIMTKQQLIRKHHDLSHIIDNDKENVNMEKFTQDIEKLQFPHKIVSLDSVSIPKVIQKTIYKYSYLIEKE